MWISSVTGISKIFCTSEVAIELVHLGECKTFAAQHKPFSFVTSNDNLFKLIKFTLTSSVWNFWR